VATFADLDSELGRLDPDVAFPVGELGQPRGRQGAPREAVALPEGWLDDTHGSDLDLTAAEVGVSGG